jgi:hypothetical protein
VIESQIDKMLIHVGIFLQNTDQLCPQPRWLVPPDIIDDLIPQGHLLHPKAFIRKIDLEPKKPISDTRDETGLTFSIVLPNARELSKKIVEIHTVDFVRKCISDIPEMFDRYFFANL